MKFLLKILIFIAIIVNSMSGFKKNDRPFPWPFVGSIYYFQKLSKKLGGSHFAFLKLSKKYNSDIISLRLGANDTIIVSSSKLVQEVLSKKEYNGRPWNEFIKIRNMGMKKGITMNDGQEWTKLRSWSIRTLKNIAFDKQEMMQFFMDELALILEKLKDGGVQDIHSIIAPTIINVFWTLTTGMKLSENSSRLQKFFTLMRRRSVLFDMSGGILSALPWLRYVAPEISGYKTLVALNNELKNLLMEAINKHKQQYVKGEDKDFIDAFLQEMYTENDKSIFSDDNLILTLLDFFIAGIQTTTATLDFLFLQIANHQDIQRKLHEEIDVVIGSNKLPTLEDRIRMPFTEAVLCESQRIWQVTPIIGPRRVLNDTTLGGYTIPKNTTVLINLFCNNMNPELFPDPTLFKPERHLNKQGAYQMDQNVILFGKGKRRCPGEILAKSALFLLFVGIMQKYYFRPVPGEKSIKIDYTSGLIMEPKPYQILIVPRNVA
ncbi:hypothetical protein ACFW04_004856 [Cataglyphis niger]